MASVSFTAIGWGWPRALGAAAAAFALGLAAEWAGTRTGFPFGAYRYTGLLRPAAATVPLVVPLAWAAMGLPGYAVGATVARTRAGRIAVGAVALTAWDLFLDPQMIRNGFWRWAHPGPYQGVPLSNFAGWLLVSAALMAVFDGLLRSTITAAYAPPPRAAHHLHRDGRDGNGGVCRDLPPRPGDRPGRGPGHGHPGRAGLDPPYPHPDRRNAAPMSDVVVIGGGVGSMATAIRLAARGHRVQLFERRHELGGKLTERRRDGFAFGLGPSLLTLPDLFGALAAEAGRKLDELVTLTEVDPVCRYHFPDGSVLDARSDPGAMAARGGALLAGAGPGLAALLRVGGTVLGGERAGVPVRPAGPARAGPPPGQPVRPVRQRARADAGRAGPPLLHRPPPDPVRVPVRDLLGFGSPYQAPAAVGCIPYLEHARGAWYVEGGLARLRDALARLLADLGVVVHTGATVSQVLTADGQPAPGRGPGWPGRGRAGPRPGGGVLVAGERVPADIVVCGADSARLYRDLWPSRAMRRRIARIGPSSSGFLVLAALRGRTSGLAHHNVIFSADYRAEFADIFDRRRPPADPTIYVGCPAAQDPATAPPGHEGLTLLVNVPAGSPGNWGRSAAGLRGTAAGQAGRRGRSACATGCCSPRPSPRPTSSAATTAGWARSTGPRTTAGWRRSAGRATGARWPGCTWSAGRCTRGRAALVVIGSRIVADLVTEDLATGRI